MKRAATTLPALLSMLIEALALGLVGCGHVHLYDAPRDTLAQTAVGQLDGARLDELNLDKVKALDAQLQYALTVAGETDSFLLQNDLLQMAASDDKTLADWVAAADRRIRDLGFPSRSAVRDFIIADIDRSAASARAERSRGDLASLVPDLMRELPACAPTMPAEWGALQRANADVRAAATDTYRRYRTSCQEPDAAGLAGEIAAAFADYDVARTSLAQRDKDALTLKADIDKLKADLAKSVQAPSDIGTRIRATAQRVDTTLIAIENADTNLALEVLPDATIDALQLILGQLHGGELAESEDLNQELLTAAHIARAAPALADDMDALIDRARQPPVSHLVIELQRQLILAQHARAFRELLVRRIELQRTIYEARVAQASAYRDFVMQLCNFAYPDLRQGCDQELTRSGAGANCGFGTAQTGCRLDVGWQTAFASQGAPKRAVLRAVTALVDAHGARSAEMTAQLRINDLYYRETLLASETAVAQWNNLIKVPADQIASFYKSGLRTEELSDFLVKIVGLVSLGVIGND